MAPIGTVANRYPILDRRIHYWPKYKSRRPDLNAFIVIVCESSLAAAAEELGMMIDSIPVMLLTVPIFWPVAQALGIDPIMFALVGILVVEVGVLTPPFGISIFVVKAAVPDPAIRLREIFIGTIPYWILILFVAWVVYFWPPIATWLPGKI